MSTNDAKQIVTQLQRVMLQCVFNQEPLPGQSAPIRFADLNHITERDTVFLSDENVDPHLTLEGTDKQLKVVPESKIRKKAVDSGDLPYIHFRRADHTNDQVRLIMDVRIAPSETNIQTLGLGALRVTFQRFNDDRWEVKQQPEVIAM